MRDFIISLIMCLISVVFNSVLPGTILFELFGEIEFEYINTKSFFYIALFLFINMVRYFNYFMKSEDENRSLRQKISEYELQIKQPKYISSSSSNTYLVGLTTTNSNKKYTLKANIETIHIKMLTYNDNASLKEETSYETIYKLNTVYWNNGGHLTFGIDSHSNSINNNLILNENTTIYDSHDTPYTILFENELYIESREYVTAEKETYDKYKNFQKQAIKEINTFIDKKLDYNYLSEFITDYRWQLNDRYATYLREKKRPAFKTADKISELSKKLRDTEKQYKSLAYQMSIYEDIFPWLTEFKEVSTEEIEAIADEHLTEDSEQVRLSRWLTAEEYNSLTTAEKYQKALDNYKKSKKTNWQIGIAYERYIGYLYETDGYKTTYYGATKGFNDLGRDLIATKDNEIIVIQCKYWSESKTIHEKHIFQLYGTMFAMSIDYPDKDIKGLFVTSAALSDTAKLYAEKLNISIEEHSKLNYDYPCIKCNISRHTGEKIYHLPFDQQYDNIEISPSHGECYVSTVKEAEELGFRRAFKWYANN